MVYTVFEEKDRGQKAQQFTRWSREASKSSFSPHPYFWPPLFARERERTSDGEMWAEREEKGMASFFCA